MDQKEFTRSLQELLSAAMNVSMATLDGCIDRVLMATRDVLGADGAALLLLDEHDQLRLTGTSDEAARVLEAAQIRLGLGPAIDSLDRKDVVRIVDLCEQGAYRELADTVAVAGVRAVLAVPVIVQTSAVGALNVYRSVPYEWSAPDLAAGRSYATLLGLLLRIAVEAGYNRPDVHRMQEIVSRIAEPEDPDGAVARGTESRDAGRS
jgi:GAF domain-containing protein